MLLINLFQRMRIFTFFRYLFSNFPSSSTLETFNIVNGVTIGKFDILRSRQLSFTRILIFSWNLLICRRYELFESGAFFAAVLRQRGGEDGREDGVFREVRPSIIENKLDYGGNPCTRRCGCRGILFAGAPLIDELQMV